MALYSLIALTASLGLGGGLAQDPMFDLQIATPVVAPDSTVAVQGQALTSDNVAKAVESKRLSVQFRNAKLSDVLDWLEKADFDFVISDSDVDKTTGISMKITDQPAERVLDALASALGGHWERESGIRTFRKGASIRFYGAPAAASGFNSTWVTSADAFAPMSVAKARSVPSAPAAPSAPAMPGIATVPAMPAVPPIPQIEMKEIDVAMGKDFQKKMEAMAKDIEKKFGPEFQRKMEAHAKQMQNMKLAEIDQDRMVRIVEKRNKDAEKMAVEAMKRADVAQKRAHDVEVRAYTFDGDGKVYVNTRNGARKTFITPSFPVDGLDLPKFLKNLSSDQKDTQRKQGYIRYDDLSKEQKKLLGVRPSGKFEITFKVNQDEVSIRG